MPRSKTRQKHQHGLHTVATTRKPKGKRSAALIFGLLLGFIGLAVAYFTVGANTLYIVAGIAVGVLLGYLIGNNIDKSANKVS